MADINIKDLNGKRQLVAAATAHLFGNVNTDNSFWLLPPDEHTRLEAVVMDEEESAIAVAIRLLGEVASVQVYGQVILVPAAEAKTYNAIFERGEGKGYRVVHRAQTDPRGGLLDNWSDKELRNFIADNGIAKTTKGLDRDEMYTLIRDDYYGNVGNGARMAAETEIVDAEEVLEDLRPVRASRKRPIDRPAAHPAVKSVTSTDHKTTKIEADEAPKPAGRKPVDQTGKRLVKIFEAINEAQALRGQANTAKPLKRSLEVHVDDLFATGRKSRVAEMKRLLKMVAVNDQTYDGILAALVSIGKEL